MSTVTTSARPARRTQAERREATRGRILDASAELLRRKGYAGFRVSEVAQAAEVSRGAQTHHFATKSSLLLATLEKVLVESKMHTLQTIDSMGRDEDLVSGLLAEAEEFFLGPNFSIASDLLNMGDGDEALRQQVRALSREHRLPLEAAWRQALVDRGVPPERAENIMWISYAIFRGLAIRRLIQEDPAHNKRVVDQWREIATAMIAESRAAS